MKNNRLHLFKNKIIDHNMNTNIQYISSTNDYKLCFINIQQFNVSMFE